MKKNFGKYLRNPAPFALVVANPKGKKRAKKKARRNPAKKGVYVIAKPARNPSKKKRAAKRRNPISRAKSAPLKPISRTVAKIQLRENPTQKPMKTRKRRKARKSSVKRNPVRRSRARRTSRRRRNPSAKMFRNPSALVSELFSANNLTLAGGVVIGTIAPSMIINRIVAPKTGVVPFKLPLVDYTAAPAEFFKKNWIPLLAYKSIIGLGAGYLLRNQSPRLSQGLLIGSIVGMMNDGLKYTGVLNSLPQTGTGRYFPSARGAGSYTPGVNPRFTGPAAAFLTRQGSPMPRGTGASVSPAFARRAPSMVENPFSN